MTASTIFIVARHPRTGQIVAAVDPFARHIEPRLARSRYEAFHSPFPSETDARAALKAAGARIVPGDRS